MSKNNSAPTLGWVIMSTINKWVVLISLAVLIVIASGVYVVWSQVKNDCSKPYSADWKIASYWIHFEAGSTRDGCSQFSE